MLNVRRGGDRGHFDHGWLEAYHTFSFAGYQDERFMGFRSLRVINEDRIAAGRGFGRHPHRDMEILTYVLSGELEHQDSLGNSGVIRPGLLQYMAAGSGILHSERNPSLSLPVHLIQIWIEPRTRGADPRYEQREFPTLSGGGLTLLASVDSSASRQRRNRGSSTARRGRRCIDGPV
jgi:quercetin 2,3-dioxygenase